MNLAEYGIDAQISRSDSGVIILDLVTTNALVVKVNGQSVTGLARAGDNNPDRTRATFWQPNGTQTTDGTVDLRGENR